MIKYKANTIRGLIRALIKTSGVACKKSVLRRNSDVSCALITEKQHC